jgi:hypothetical protein
MDTPAVGHDAKRIQHQVSPVSELSSASKPAEDLIGEQPKAPLLRTTSGAISLIPSNASKETHAPRRQEAPVWQPPSPPAPSQGKTLAASSPGALPPGAQGQKKFIAADGAPAPSAIHAIVALLDKVLSSRSSAAFERVVECVDIESLKLALNYLDGSILEDLIHAGRIGMIRKFLRCFGDDALRFINGPERRGQFDALGAAASGNQVCIGLMLIEAGARPESNCPKKFLDNMLKEAIAEYKWGLVSFLAYYADPALLRNLPTLPSHDEPGSHQDMLDLSGPMFFHLANRNKAALTSIYSAMFNHAGTRGSDKLFFTLLHRSMVCHGIDALRLVFAARPESMKAAKPVEGYDVYMIRAAKQGNTAVLEVLLDFHPLIRPARNDGGAISRSLNFLDDTLFFSGRAIDKEDDAGNTLLYHAARSENVATMALLLERGADGKKLLGKEAQRLIAPTLPYRKAYKALPAWTIDYLAMKSSPGSMRSTDQPRVIKRSLSRIVDDAAVVGTALSGRAGGPTAAQSIMIRAGMLAQSTVPGFLADEDPYEESGLDAATIDALNVRLQKWREKPVEEGEALEAPFRKLVSDLWAFIHSHDVDDATMGRVLKDGLMEQGMYGLLADCVVAAWTTVASDQPSHSHQNADERSFALALRQEIWFSRHRQEKRYQAAETSVEPVLFDVLMRRQLHVIEQYCDAFRVQQATHDGQTALSLPSSIPIKGLSES